MTVRESLAGRAEPMVWRRPRLVAAVLSAVVSLAAVTSCTVEAGSAVLIDGTAISEQAVQHASSEFVAEVTRAQGISAGAARPTDVDLAGFNRSQITYLVRHALIAEAISTQGIVITNQQLADASAQVKAQNSSTGLAEQLDLPASDEDGVLHDLVALDAMVKALPAAGVPVSNVSVTAEGVPAASRDAAVALRSKFLADPGQMDGAVVAAGDNGVQKNVYSLIQAPSAGSAGLYSASSGSVVILPSKTGYLVLRTSVRTTATTALTASAFTSASSSVGLSGVFDLGALLVAKYQQGVQISVNPRYGVWDPASVQVVPGNDGL